MVRTSWNKGLKGWTNSGSFKKGHKGFYKGKFLPIKQIKKLYIKNKWSLSDIAKKYSITPQGIRYQMLKHNISRRSHGVHTEKSKKKISDIQKKIPHPKGKEHPNWKGGITSYTMQLRNSEKYKEWRENIFKRDNYICQECGLHSGNGKKVILNAHHKIPFCKLIKTEEEWKIFDINNGITFCIDCHDLTKLGEAT